MTCSSAVKRQAVPSEFECGPVRISNSEHPEYTLVRQGRGQGRGGAGTGAGVGQW